MAPNKNLVECQIRWLDGRCLIAYPKPTWKAQATKPRKRWADMNLSSDSGGAFVGFHSVINGASPPSGFFTDLDPVQVGRVGLLSDVRNDMMSETEMVCMR